MRRSVSPMLRAFLMSIVTLAIASPALAAADLDTCRDIQADLSLRLAACEDVIAEGKVSGKSIAAAYQVRGDALIKKRDYDGAIAAFSAAHDADPDNVGYLNSRGIAYNNKGDDEHAMADFNECLRLRPGYASAFNNRGLVFMRKGELQNAFDDFSAAIRNNNQNRYIAYINRGHVLTLRKEYEAAIDDFAQAQQLNPTAWQVQNYRCAAHAEMGKFDAALADCSEVIAKFPKSSYALASRGNAYLAKGNLDAALDDYNLALKLNPNYVRAYAGRAQLFEKRGDKTSARADYRAASAALSKFDDIDTSIARRNARERLAVLTPQAPAQATARRIALIVRNRPYRNVPHLNNPPRDARLIA